MARSVLFVCLGNICRSPSAEGVFRAFAAGAGLKIEADSAGLGRWHLGNPPYGPAIRAAAARGYDLSRQRARQVSGTDFERFDLILGMDDDNVAGLEALRPAGNTTPVRLLLDYAPDTGVREVPDPYYTGDFGTALDLVEAAALGLIDAFRR
ncbi:MAG: low molecular weight protein-tyrosine-phosphatase [Rhodobacter sp.]|nr:low molecular weight protein-tyrosine-phosphatase [Rhodobacter sp.]